VTASRAIVRRIMHFSLLKYLAENIGSLLIIYKTDKMVYRPQTHNSDQKPAISIISAIFDIYKICISNKQPK
jgi:hypothetical protein